MTSTLSIVGNGTNDEITVEGNTIDATQFALSSPGTDTFNGNLTSFFCRLASQEHHDDASGR